MYAFDLLENVFSNRMVGRKLSKLDKIEPRPAPNL